MSIFKEKNSVKLWAFFDEIYKGEFLIHGAEYDEYYFVENRIIKNRLDAFYKKKSHSAYEIEELKYLFRHARMVSDENVNLYKRFFKKYMKEEIEKIKRIEEEEKELEGLMKSVFGM